MVAKLKRKGVWIGGAVAALLVAIVFFSTQAFSSGLTATAEPIQNTGADGVINFKQDWSAASAVITRHESSVIALDASDQVASVTVKGTKSSGAVDVKVDLLDVSQTILDSATVNFTDAGAYSGAGITVTLPGSIKLVGVAKVLATYTASGSTITLNLTDGFDSKGAETLINLSTFSLINSSNDNYLLLDTSGGTPAYFISLQFDQTVPVGATINSVKVYIEHYEDNGYTNGQLTWEVGTGTLSSPTVLGSTNPTTLKANQEAVVEWDVSAWIDTLAEANDLKLKVVNNSTNGKKVNLDHAYVVVNYTP